MVIGGRCGGYWWLWCVVVVVVAAIISKDLNQLHFEVVVVHSQDEERDEVVVVFCVNTGRLLGTFEGSRESLLGGGVSLLFLMPFCHLFTFRWSSESNPEWHHGSEESCQRWPPALGSNSGSSEKVLPKLLFLAFSLCFLNPCWTTGLSIVLPHPLLCLPSTG